MELLSTLLENAYAEPGGASAGERISDIRFYLHTKQVDVLDYTADTAYAFEKMPAAQDMTIRPALVAGSRILRKGLAGIAPAR